MENLLICVSLSSREKLVLHEQFHTTKLKRKPQKDLSLWDFPDIPVLKNLLYHLGNVGSIPGRGTKIPQAM